MSSVYMQHDDDSTPCLCSNCGTATRFVELNAIDDIEQRITPGEEVPAGECPECGCLAYLVKPKVWTVLLARPDYIANDQFDTYMTHVEAENTMHALLKAQKEAYEHDYDEDERAEGIGAAADYRPLLVIEGNHMDVQP